MKKLLIGLLCLVPSAALAYDLPLSAGANYCGETVRVDRQGIHSRYDGGKFSCVAKAAPAADIIPMTCTDRETGKPFAANISLSENKARDTLILIGSIGDRSVLHPCRQGE